MKGLKDDDVRTKDEARTTPVAGEVMPPAQDADADLTARLQAEAAQAELRAAEARERAERARPADSGR
jgi:sec-independent protein translocase protein TatA